MGGLSGVGMSGCLRELALAASEFRRHREATADPDKLGKLLYQSWYSRPLVPVHVPEDFPSDLVQALRAADETARLWEEGWSVERINARGSVIARRGREVRMAERCDYVSEKEVGILPQPGEVLILADRRDRVDPDGAWWRTGGRAWRFTREVPGLVRFYWHFDFAHLPAVVGGITRILVGLDGPWMLKCAVNPALHARADATVLYLTLDAAETLACRIDTVASALAPLARSAGPPLTLPIHPGVAVAFDPGEGQSFGEHRCRVIAKALCATPSPQDDVALGAIAVGMEAEGIDPDRPYAGQGDPLLPWER